MSDALDILRMYMHIGAWLSPVLSGDRPPASDGFTFTSVDSHRAVLFGGILHDRRYINDVYVIDFRKMASLLCLHCFSACTISLALQKFSCA